MRAILLLCLVHAALAKRFLWSPTATPDTDPYNVCVKNQGSCGCCLMVKEINRLIMYFKTMLNKLEEEYMQTEQRLHNIKASRSAFSVSLTNESNFNCFGPFKVDKLIPYKHVFINLGDGYSVETGIFTVPLSGVYSLAVTIFSDAGSAGALLAACASLQVNDEVIVSGREKNTHDQEDSSTIVVARNLKAGDKVAVNLPIGCFLCDDSNYNTFSVFLLYPTV
ncbi:complement C1q-like protein 4 [Cottoperca gobio]|uniref:Complement C1q-like protein 4 n=1 Tax=Cottoperca gobio TaxID=56716 RepID=A0A6J2QWF6_COTGO|nr:complement C1q-like protein 4 [Cottoperca gobio]